MRSARHDCIARLTDHVLCDHPDAVARYDDVIDVRFRSGNAPVVERKRTLGEFPLEEAREPVLTPSRDCGRSSEPATCSTRSTGLTGRQPAARV
jgi:hypothetical protein